MSQKSVAAGLIIAPAYSDSDEDFDLTDTKLLSSDDEDLKKYIDLPSNKAGSVASADGDYIQSFRFIPLTSESVVTKEENDVATKEAPILVLSDTEDDVVEIDLKYTSSIPSDPPDYESPVEDENKDRKPAHLESPDKEDLSDPAYDELLEMCGQDVGNMDDRMDDDDFDDHHDDDNDYDDDDYHQTGSPKVKVKSYQKRISPYNLKNRSIPVQGKGKQLVSGTCRFKSTQKKMSPPVANDSDQDLVFSDSGRPICFGDSLIDLNSPVKEEEKPAAPPPPMICESCEKEEGHNNMVQCCDGHIVCTRCVEASTKKVLVGEKKGSVECSHSDCTSSVPMSELRKALPAIVLDLLEDKWNKETLEALENMKDSVKCPGCNYSAVLDMSMKRFQCVQCKEAYCRYCDRKWSDRKTHDLCIRTKQWTSTVTGNVVNIPAQWSDAETDAMEGKSESHTLVELDATSAEFYDVVHLMNKHMKSSVRKIFRIQNERLWEKYSLTRSHMVADLGELNINEKRLFHGTHADVIEAICKEGFDWRLCGKHGTVYGQGTYFAKSPVISHRYSSGNLSRRSRNIPFGATGYSLFFGTSGRQPTQYKPPLRFGAPVSTTQTSGFTFGAPLTTTKITGFTLAVSRPSQPSSNFVFGSPAACSSGTAPTTSSSFTFGSSSVTYPNTGFALTASANNPVPVFRFGSTGGNQNPGTNASVGIFGAAVTKKHKLTPVSRQGGNDNNKLNLPDPACLHSQQNQSAVSSTTRDNSAADFKRSCSNCIFCSAANKTKNSSSSANPVVTGAASKVPATSSTGNGAGVGTSLKDIKIAQDPYVKLLKKAGLYKSAAHLFVRAVPAQPPVLGFSASGGGSSGNVGSSGGFVFGGTSGGNSNTGGSGNGAGGGSSGGTGGFGVDSDKSSDYDHFMFLARVLVGRSCLGTHEMRRPAKDREGRDTHSAVDREHKPSIFVIFDNNQCYPEYIIQYSTSSIV